MNQGGRNMANYVDMTSLEAIESVDTGWLPRTRRGWREGHRILDLDTHTAYTLRYDSDTHHDTDIWYWEEAPSLTNRELNLIDLLEDEQ